MNMDTIRSVSRALDAAIRWHAYPRWCRKGTMSDWMRRAYHRSPTPHRASRDARIHRTTHGKGDHNGR